MLDQGTKMTKLRNALDPETIMAKQNINRENYHKRVQRARKDVKDRLDLMGLKEDEVFPLLK